MVNILHHEIIGAVVGVKEVILPNTVGILLCAQLLDGIPGARFQLGLGGGGRSTGSLGIIGCLGVVGSTGAGCHRQDQRQCKEHCQKLFHNSSPFGFVFE